MDRISVRDFETAAAERLEGMAFDYYASGARDEVTLRENADAYRRIFIRYRVLRDISSCDTSTRLLRHGLATPILVAPTAFHRLACEAGEVATARAASRAGTTLILSTLSTTAMEDVVAATDGAVWFQLYVYRDREATAELVRRAEAAGCSAIVLTVDAQVWGVRERDVRNRFALPPDLTLPNLQAEASSVEHEAADSGLSAYVTRMFDRTLAWSDVAWLTEITDLPILLKGIVHPEDGRLAVEHGASGVIVSNHGGRQLDGAPATIDALPDVVEAVRDAAGEGARFPVLLDGGIRRGTDVVKALASGADAVCVGRPVLWGLAVDGEWGASRVLEILTLELENAMRLCGVTSVEELREQGPDLLFRPNA
ncbi:MAG: alpha-hydroxy acid oxidase [Gemmatimonadota bacterium]|nr:alpha-hydroxy acid oxidase [Gemmatimonadota bacterium]